MTQAQAQPSDRTPDTHRWLASGGEAYPRMLAAVANARHCVRLETYIFQAGHPGDAFRDALVQARKRGLEVRVLLDAYGSVALPESYWKPLLAAGGNVRYFNPLRHWRPWVRDHRKLLVCDEEEAFAGSFNITEAENGDGITGGWANAGLELRGPCVREFALSFDTLFYASGRFSHRLLPPPTHPGGKPRYQPGPMLLANGPFWKRSPIKHALIRDFRKAKSEIMIVSAYFLPTWTLRRALARAVRRGCRVRLVLAGRSDVPLSQLAGRHLYRRLLRAGVEIYEYQPQILHTKLMIADRAAYAGSANLDTRSLNINCELLVRLADPDTAWEARKIFEGYLHHSRRILPEEWAKSRGLWQRLKENVAYWLLARLDPYFSRRGMRGNPDNRP